MVDTTGKFAFLLVVLINYGIPAMGYDMKQLEDDAQGSLEALDNILSSFQGDETCEYKCPNEGEIKKPKPGHKPTSNGCGSFGIKLETRSLPEMTQCCDKHDYCYDTCGNDRAECDGEFQMCLYQMCEDKKGSFTNDQYEGCSEMAGLVASTASAMGCLSYKRAQMRSCSCAVDKPSHTFGIMSNELELKSEVESSKENYSDGISAGTPELNRDDTVVISEVDMVAGKDETASVEGDDSDDAVLVEEEEEEEGEEEKEDDVREKIHSGHTSEDMWAKTQKMYKESLKRLKELDDIEVPEPPLSEIDEEIEEMMLQDAEIRKYVEEFQQDDLLASFVRGDEDALKKLDDILPPAV